jgi:hypothetical protein
MQITTIGLDIDKNVFQVRGIDAGESSGGNFGAARCWRSSRHSALPSRDGTLRVISLLGT